jgi:predicted ATP-dependent serine protease
VGHVTKDGQIAGPRVLEHMVDAVFYFEGERGHQFRILRSVKNRFGPTDEIGVFEMGEEGLVPARDPSALFLAGSEAEASGRAVFAAMEGSRPVLAEVQALAGTESAGSPRRSIVGWDSARLAMLQVVVAAAAGAGERAAYGGTRRVDGAAALLGIEEAADLAVQLVLLAPHGVLAAMLLLGKRPLGIIEGEIVMAGQPLDIPLIQGDERVGTAVTGTFPAVILGGAQARRFLRCFCHPLVDSVVAGRWMAEQPLTHAMLRGERARGMMGLGPVRGAMSHFFP